MLRIATIATMLWIMCVPGHAQQKWPSHPITIIVPYAAGSAPDSVARVLASQLSPRLGQPVVVENRAGAGGMIGTEAAATAMNDGYTLFLGTLDTQAIIGHLNRAKKADPATLQPISLLGRIVNVIAASPTLDVRTFEDLVSAGKSGRSFTFATPGVGSNLHLIGELVRISTGANLVHVPYRAMSGAYTDAMEGRIDLVIAGHPPLAALLRDGKLKPLVTTAPERVAALPDTPTMAELGKKELTVIGWFGLLAPAGMSSDIVDRLNAEVKAIGEDKDYRARLQGMFIEPSTSSVSEFTAMIKAESERFGDVIRRSSIQLQ